MQPGRPNRHESRRRTQELLRRLADGESLADAAKGAQVKPERVLTLLADRPFRDAVNLLLAA